MAKGKDATRTRMGVSESAGGVSLRKQAEEVLLKAGALQRAIFNSANFSSIATDAKGVIQIFNVGAERMLVLEHFAIPVHREKQPVMAVRDHAHGPVQRGGLDNC